MPELQHHFRVGRMNKDLDERLVPNGEYRDAQNIEIVTSEGSDVGSVQNVIGNQLKDGKTYNASTTALALWGTSNSTGNKSIKELTSPECIGSVVDNQNDKIYWFIKATGVSVIAEFNHVTNEIKPILVDKNSVLNFSNQYLITGANVIEGLLLWTDNQTEPKKLKISSFKSGSTDFNTHTTFNGSNFTENDITTIKLSPLKAPTLTMSASKRGGAGAGIGTEVYTNFDFTYDEDSSNLTPNIARPAGQEVTLNFTPKPSYLVGDIITLTYDHTDSDNKETTYKVKILIKTLVNDAEQVVAIIQSIPTDTPIGVFSWEAILDEEEPLFENKFVRFGYRWKYKDGEYSTYSPFSTIAFLPDTFIYKSSDGHNAGMSNNVRQLTIGGFDIQPADVDEVDILYKESNSNLVYVADTLKNNETSYEIKSEIIGSVVESNQILRPWDNVPKRAKAQEVTANRLIYANYYQNYDILKQNLPDIQTIITQKEITTIGEPEASLKSLRTYQAGGIYIDTYGRETPVFSNKSAAQQIGKTYAESVNNLTCKMLNDPPSWATHFKYFIKETSNEYYNLALDRFYIAEDGNVWLSFPSSERNKIKEDAYLILKKQHDKSKFVASAAKYKVLDISNEAPAFITKEIKTISSAKCKILTAALNAPGIGRITFQFRGPKDTENTNFARGFTSDGMLTITTTGGTTERYEIASGGATGQEDAATDTKTIYEVTLTKPLKDTESAVFASGYTDAHDELTIALYEEQNVDKAEFFGRFFVKINRDTVFDTNIIDTFPSMDTEYAITRNRMVDVDSSNDWGSGGIFVTILLASVGIPSAPHWFEKSSNAETLSWTDTQAKSNSKDHEDGVRKDFRQLSHDHPSLGDKDFTVYWSGVKTSLGKDRSHDAANTLNPFLEALGQSGTLFQFVNNDGYEGTIYEITGTSIDYQYRGGRKQQQKKITGKRRAYTISFKNVDTGEGYDDNFLYANSSGTNGRIVNIRIMQKLLPFDNESLTSENPAVFETEPREAIDLELFYEASNSLPIIKQGMKVSGTGIPAGRTIAGIIDKDSFKLSGNTNAGITNGTLTITSADDVYNFTVTASASNSATTITLSEGQVHGQLQTLDWFNCYSFGQGVESDRLKDDYNAVKIDKGPKVSSVLAEQYKEDQKQNGLIWSGIFNSTSGINRLNQFVQAEPITKDLNPQYGSIQKLRARDTDLIAFCEDKVLKILANKDALYEAGGNQQLTATNRVLGQSIPYLGEFGISKNPESFASHAYRVYFTDKSRGAVLRLSRDGLTNIAQKGMTDWFKDNLATSTTLLGAYDEYKGSYNLTLKGTNDYNVCFDERVDGWTSFKTFIPESSCSLNNTYYSFKDADLYSHDNVEGMNSKNPRWMEIQNEMQSIKKAYDNFSTNLNDFKISRQKAVELRGPAIVDDENNEVAQTPTSEIALGFLIDREYGINNEEKGYGDINIADDGSFTFDGTIWNGKEIGSGNLPSLVEMPYNEANELIKSHIAAGVLVNNGSKKITDEAWMGSIRGDIHAKFRSMGNEGVGKLQAYLHNDMDGQGGTPAFITKDQLLADDNPEFTWIGHSGNERTMSYNDLMQDKDAMVSYATYHEYEGAKTYLKGVVPVTEKNLVGTVTGKNIEKLIRSNLVAEGPPTKLDDEGYPLPPDETTGIIKPGERKWNIEKSKTSTAKALVRSKYNNSNIKKFPYSKMVTRDKAFELFRDQYYDAADYDPADPAPPNTVDPYSLEHGSSNMEEEARKAFENEYPTSDGNHLFSWNGTNISGSDVDPTNPQAVTEYMMANDWLTEDKINIFENVSTNQTGGSVLD